jgi:methionyl-tRNA formyltransferase
MEGYKGKKFCFAGNRFFVLQAMLDAGLEVSRIFAVKGSFLERELGQRQIPFESIQNKEWLVQQLTASDFDYLISNGLPVILPITKLTAGNHKKFINIHPSYLPDLRGIDPVPGSLLHGRNSGATCHYMNDQIDRGDIIAQVLIPYSEDIDCGLLYQLSFLAERDAFAQALRNNFAVAKPQVLEGGEIYYNLKEADKAIDFSKSAEVIVRQVKAFNTRSQGAYFMFEGQKVVVRDAEVVTNSYLLEKTVHLQDNEVVFVYENRILIKKTGGCLKLKQIDALPAGLKAGCYLAGF